MLDFLDLTPECPGPMIRRMSSTASLPFAVSVVPSSRLPERLPALTQFALGEGITSPARHPSWLNVLREGLDHETYAIEAVAEGQTCGFLPLAFVSSLLFGRFLVSLPYLSSNGVVAAHPDVQSAIIERAVGLADELDVRYLELRHEAPIEHPLLDGKLTSKVHMRLALPDSTEKLWKGFDSKVRNQVRKGEKHHSVIQWGGEDLLDPFYEVLSRNMRDLGTPVFGKELFGTILKTFRGDAEICVVRAGEAPAAAALLLHGRGMTEVPTASSLKEYNSTSANMLMYRHLIDRAVDRGQKVFDFGRSTLDGPTFKFKKQWGAEPVPATWQYHLRDGQLGDMRPDSPRYQRAIRLWQRLPVRLTQYLGPPIVRGIP